MNPDPTRTPSTPTGMAPPAARRGFTLTELLVVIVIIGIILVFILVAAQDSRRRAEEAATLALIVRLEEGVTDRLDALLQTRPEPNAAHYYMAGIFTGTTDGGGNLTPVGTYPLGSAAARAQVIAYYDYIKSEMPDVFYVQNTTGPYPLNFAFPTAGYPGAAIDANGFGNAILPLGNSIAGPLPAGYGSGNLSNTVGTGIFGASYNAAAGIYKNLGYLPAGFDGTDNNGNGAIDEWSEGVNSTNQAQVEANLAAHKHSTARSEMLYAILVEGVGPFGSVFNRDDFSDREVKDTDGDGLPEFVDAWGQPLQFFRWPIMYHTDLQRGIVIDYADLRTIPPTPDTLGRELINLPYRTVFEAREQSRLDPNQQLMAPAWWASSVTGTNTNSPFAGIGSSSTTAAALGGSGGAQAFEHFFHRLTEPVARPGAATDPQFFWDRGTTTPFAYRRAFFTKPLILSSGPDQSPGIYLIPDGAPSVTGADLLVEDGALPINPALFNSGQLTPGPITDAVSLELREASRDDITNQARSASGSTGGP